MVELLHYLKRNKIMYIWNTEKVRMQVIKLILKFQHSTNMQRTAIKWRLKEIAMFQIIHGFKK